MWLEKLLGYCLPGTGELYVRDWDGRYRGMTCLEGFTRTLLTSNLGGQVPVSASFCHLPNSNDLASERKMVPRDRIELSTPAFSEVGPSF